MNCYNGLQIRQIKGDDGGGNKTWVMSIGSMSLSFVPNRPNPPPDSFQRDYLNFHVHVLFSVLVLFTCGL